MSNIKLAQKTTTNFVLTKQLQLSLKILQMNAQELDEFISANLEENPFLSDKSGEQSDNLHDTLAEEYRYEKNGTTNNNDFDVIANISNDSISLYQHLNEQIRLVFKPGFARDVAFKIAENIDENGYINAEISKSITGVTKEDVEKVIAKLQELEPAGVFARSLSECLKIQLEDKGIFNNKFSILLENMHLIAKGEIAELCRKCEATKEEIISMTDIIKSLDPKPGSNFCSAKAQNLIPDILVKINDKDEIILSLQNRFKLNVRKGYYKSLISSILNKKDKEFCSDKYQSASWIYKSVEQRGETLLKVVKAIATQQLEFFKRGVMFLKPMKLADIAGAVNMHESSISRISNKVIGTSFGNFEIKYFFSSSIKGNYTEDVFSSVSVKQKIKKMIEEEGGKVLSDQKISDLLNDMGLKVSRRTVTKYREAINIPTSSIRKRRKVITSIK